MKRQTVRANILAHVTGTKPVRISLTIRPRLSETSGIARLVTTGDDMEDAIEEMRDLVAVLLGDDVMEAIELDEHLTGSRADYQVELPVWYSVRHELPDIPLEGRTSR